MSKLSSLPQNLREKYEWQCFTCNHSFKSSHGLRCPKCGGSVQKIGRDEIEKIKDQMEIGD